MGRGRGQCRGWARVWTWAKLLTEPAARAVGLQSLRGAAGTREGTEECAELAEGVRGEGVPGRRRRAVGEQRLGPGPGQVGERSKGKRMSERRRGAREPGRRNSWKGGRRLAGGGPQRAGGRCSWLLAAAGLSGCLGAVGVRIAQDPGPPSSPAGRDGESVSPRSPAGSGDAVLALT